MKPSSPELRRLTALLQIFCRRWRQNAQCALGGVMVLCVLSASRALATGSYAVQVLSNNPVAFWQLNETGDPSSGILPANDSSGNGYTATYGTSSLNGFNGILSPQPPQFPGFAPGQGALQTSYGVSASSVAVPPLNLTTNAVTIAMWINPNGPQNPLTGLFVSRNSTGDTRGFAFGPFQDSNGMANLAYTWNTNAQATWAFPSGIYPVAGIWQLTALVVQSNSATIYLCYSNAGGIHLESALNTITHTTETFSDGATFIGANLANGNSPDPTRTFNGSISGVAVYNSALTADQVLQLFAAGLGSQNGVIPVISAQPKAQYVFAGSKAQLAANVNGTSPLYFQWQLNGTNVDLLADSTNFTGINSNRLTILSTTTNDIGTYRLIVTNGAGSTISSNATVNIQAKTLVGAWLLGSSFSDVSGYPLATNHGAFLVGAGNYVFTNDVPYGHSGQSLLLYNGDTGLAISNSSILDSNYDDTFDNRINNSFTVSVWAKGWPGNWNPFVSKYGETVPSPAGGWQVRADASNHPCWTMRGAGGVVTLGTADGGRVDDLAAPNVTFFNDGVWHFYLCTFDANTGVRQLYADGTWVASETNVTAYTLAPLEHLCIGARDPNGYDFANFFTGQICDVRIYNFAFNTVNCAIPGSSAFYNITANPGQSVQLDPHFSSNPDYTGYGWTSNGIVIPNANTNILTVTNVTANANYSFFVTNLCGEGYSWAVFKVQLPIVLQTNLVGRWIAGSPTLADVSGYQPLGTHDGFDIGNLGGNYYFTNDVPPGRTGSSLYLANDGIFITNSSTQDAGYTNTFDETIHNAMTVAFWARGWPGQWNPWVSKYGDSTTPPTSGWQIHDSGNNANAAWTIRGTGGGLASPGIAVFGNPEDLRGTNASNDGRWHAYVGTYNSLTGIRSLYVDGILSGRETSNHLYTLAPGAHVCIGAIDSPDGNSFDRFFTGKIYDVRISSYDWSSNEVASYSAMPDPLIDPQPPNSVTGYVGGNVQITAGTRGTAPLTNQWQFNGTNLTDGFYGSTLVQGSGSNILTLYSLTTNLQGSYRLLLSNTNGMVVSSNTALSVLIPPPVNSNTLVGAWLTGPANLSDNSGYAPAGTHDGYGVQGSNIPSSHYAFTNDVPPGMTGQSLVLFGDAAIVISNSSTLDASYTNTFDNGLTNAMTIMFWAKGWPSGLWNPWVSKYGENGQGWQLRRNQVTTFSTWTIRGTGGTEDLIATIGSNDGQWHQYTGTYDFTTGIRNLFVDGLLAASESGQGPYAMAAGSHLVIGGRDYGGNNFGSYFAGELYNVRIFDYPVQVGSGCGPIPLIIVTHLVNVPFGQAVQLNSGSMQPGFVYNWHSNGVPVLNANTNILTISNVTKSAVYELVRVNPCNQSWPPVIFNVNVVTPPPTPVRLGNSLVLTWTNGTLQQATNPLGPWAPTGTTSPYTNDMSTNSQMYFRLSFP